jgi:hypothetical protein
MRAALAALLVAGALVSPFAAAQEGAAKDSEALRREEAASDLFERGKAKRAAGDHEAAAALFSASFRELPQAGTLVLLAEALEHLGRLQSAREAFTRAETLADGEGDAALAHAAHIRAAALMPRIPQLEIRTPQPAPPGLLVTLNGVEMPAGKLNTPVALDAGQYRLEATAPGYAPFGTTLQLANDSTEPTGPRVAAVTLAPATLAAPGAPEREPAPVGQDRRELAYWVGGAGAAVGAVGVVLLIIANNQFDSAHCDADTPCQRQEDVDATRTAVTLANISTVTAVVSALGIGAGAYLYLTAPEASQPAGMTGAVVGWRGAF